jgi:hypothetical protein
VPRVRRPSGATDGNTMAYNHYKPMPGRFGTMVEIINGGNPGPIAPVAVASSTVAYKMPGPAGKFYVEKIGLFIGTLATGSAAITVQAFKRNSVGSVSVALTAATDIKAGSINTARNIPITATDAQRTLQVGDYLAFDIVAAGTITLQPSDLFISPEVAVLE